MSECEIIYLVIRDRIPPVTNWSCNDRSSLPAHPLLTIPIFVVLSCHSQSQSWVSFGEIHESSLCSSSGNRHQRVGWSLDSGTAPDHHASPHADAGRAARDTAPCSGQGRSGNELNADLQSPRPVLHAGVSEQRSVVGDLVQHDQRPTGRATRWLRQP